MPTSTNQSPKHEAHKLIDELPDGVTWQELAYRLEVRADIEEGLADINAGRMTDVKDLRREYDLPE
ncbi:MAG: hypothetical protein KA739_19270 [Pseudomonadales bacterium]|nr:hypothetical protein [Pseudomonadales bacterium]MBP6229898.1 hypothetical protein [Pseudomonadales bacterium]